MNGWKAKIKKERKNEELKETIISVHSVLDTNDVFLCSISTRVV